jgi:hypothetical protein
MTSHIVVQILDRIVTGLTPVCQTNVDEDDPTYAEIVKKGLLQENKVKKNVGIGVTAGDHENPEYIDGIVTLEEFKNIGFDLSNMPREIGGGELWWRRGVVRVECFFIQEKLPEDEAYVAAYSVLGRVQNTLQAIYVGDLVDDDDERAIKLFSYGNTFFQSGGAKDSNIFRGKVFWTCLTERP